MDQVYLLECSRYDPAKIEEQIRRVLPGLGVSRPEGASVLLKPNCAFAHPRYAPASYTHPAVLRGVANALRGNTIAVGENGMIGFPTRLSLEPAGYAGLAKETPFELLPFDEGPFVSVPLSQGKAVHEITLPRAFQESKFLVSLPKFKANAFLPFSGALENHLGLLDHAVLKKNHNQIAQLMADLLEVVKPNLIVVDAVEMGDGASSVVTAPRPLGALVVGTNAVAVDVVLAAILGLDPEQVLPIQLAAARGAGPKSLSEIEILGDVTLEQLTRSAAGRVRIDPRPENHPLPKKVKVVVGKPYALAGAAGALSEMLAFLERGGISLQGARETVLVLGRSDVTQTASDDTAAIIFLGDKSYAPYKGYTRIVRLRGEPILTVQMLETVPFAMKLRNPIDDFRGALWKAQLQSKINAWRNQGGK